MSTIVLLLLLMALACGSAPLQPKSERYLDNFLSLYYDEAVGTLESEEMQSDQPVAENNSIGQFQANVSGYYNEDVLRQMRAMKKEAWKIGIKQRLMEQLRHGNATFAGRDLMSSGVNLTYFSRGVNQSHEHPIVEKVRSFYPSCDTTKYPDLEKDENMMNLFFNFDQMEGNIATATIRLYKANALNASEVFDGNPCYPSQYGGEEEKLYRVTIYYYTKPPRKHKIKKKMCDTKMISESSKWAELSVRSAAKAWLNGRNLGLAVQVEDQDKNIIRADTFFRGAACTVGSSTPQPIPTVFFDKAFELGGLLRRNATPPLHLDPPLLPTVDVCTAEAVGNGSGEINYSSLRVCNAARSQQQECTRSQQQTAPTRHIRHQRQHLPRGRPAFDDPRQRIIPQKVVLTSEQLQSFGLERLDNR